MDPKYNSEVYKRRAEFERYVRMTTSKGTALRYSASLESFFRRFPDRKNFNEFSRRDVEDYRIICLREGNSSRTINYATRVLGQLWRWLMAMDLVVYNPASQVRQLKEKESVHTSLSLEQQQQIWRGCHQWKDRLLVGLALTTGLRGETLAKLDAADIDFEHRCLNIPSAKMKAGRNHVIPLPDWVLAIIKEGPYNGVTLFGKYARTAEGVAYHWNAICRRAGLDGGGIRTARRTFATTMLRSGVDLKTVQDLLGHRNIATTSRYLTPADLPTARAAVEKIPPPNA